jgi:hypothetical protein
MLLNTLITSMTLMTLMTLITLIILIIGNLKDKLKKAIPELPDAPQQISTGNRILRNFNREEVYAKDIQEFHKVSGVDTTLKDNWVEKTPEVQVKSGKKHPVMKENKFAQLRLLDFGLLHGILVDAKASGVIVPGATQQQFKGTKEYNAAHTVGVGLKLGLF